MTDMSRPRLRALPARCQVGTGKEARGVPHAGDRVLGAAPQSGGRRGTNLRINKNSPREPGLILTLSREAWGRT